VRIGGTRATVSCELVESLGADHLVHTRLGAQDFVLRTDDAVHPESGSALGLDFSASAIHWFDAKSGQRVEK